MKLTASKPNRANRKQTEEITYRSVHNVGNTNNVCWVTAETIKSYYKRGSQSHQEVPFTLGDFSSKLGHNNV